MMAIYKKGKVQSKADTYRPISPTTSVGNVMEGLINPNSLGKVMERLINARIMWFVKNLENRKGQVQNQQHESRKEILRGGVPQGGLLSPTLFIIFMNDILNGIPACIHGALYADDLIMLCSYEQLSHVG